MDGVIEKLIALALKNNNQVSYSDIFEAVSDYPNYTKNDIREIYAGLSANDIDIVECQPYPILMMLGKVISRLAAQ